MPSAANEMNGSSLSAAPVARSWLGWELGEFVSLDPLLAFTVVRRVEEAASAPGDFSSDLFSCVGKGR